MRRALGKGLSQLIGEQSDHAPNEVPIESIVANERQPRRRFDDESLGELANSIREVGVLQPLVVRPLAEGKYELIAGERRLRASKLAGLRAVPVVVRPAGNQTSLEMALIENIQREDISPLECAQAYRRLMDEFNLTQEAVAEKVGKSRVAVANTVRLLRLPNRIREGLASGSISEGHAKALLGIEGEAAQLAVYDQILQKGLTVRDVETVGKPKGGTGARGKKPKNEQPDPNARALEDGLSIYFGTPVRLVKQHSGGRIEIDYYSDDDLERILDVLGVHL